jgi:DNA-binding Lrp family transcriptional regulator
MIWANANDMDHNENLIIKPAPIIDQDSILLKSIPPISNNEIILDEKDRQIAKILSPIHGYPLRKLQNIWAFLLKTPIQRFKKLEGNLLGLSTITLDLTKLGYNAMAHNFIKVANRSKMPEVYSKILQLPNTIVIIRMIGAYDLMTINVLEDFNDQFNLQDQMRKIKDIDSVDTYLSPVFKAVPLNVFYPLL